MKSESRDEFIKAAIRLFAEKGYHETSVDDIAASASRSKGGFYYHFESKDQVVIEIFNQMLTRTADRLNTRFQSDESVKEVILSLIQEYEPVMKDRVQMAAGANFFFLALHESHLADLIKLMNEKVASLIADVLQKGVNRGEFRKDFDVHQVAKILLSSGRGIVWMGTLCNEMDQIPKSLNEFVKLQFAALT